MNHLLVNRLFFLVGYVEECWLEGVRAFQLRRIVEWLEIGIDSGSFNWWRSWNGRFEVRGCFFFFTDLSREGWCQ